MTQSFQVTGCDKFTKKLMKTDPHLFPKSNVQSMIMNLPDRLKKLNINIGRAWNNIDVHRKGHITSDEFKLILADWAIQLGFVDEDGLSAEELDELVDYYDVDQSGRFDRQEFLAAFKGDDSVRQRALVAQQRHSSARTIETRIAEVLRSKGATDIMELFDSIDTDNNGRIDFDEFHGAYSTLVWLRPFVVLDYVLFALAVLRVEGLIMRMMM